MSRPSRSVRALILPIALAALGPSFVACGGSDDEATNGTVPVDDGEGGGAGAATGKGGGAGASGAATGKGGSGGAGAGAATGKGGSSAAGSGGSSAGSSGSSSGGSSSGGSAGAGKGGSSAGGSTAAGSGGTASGGSGGAGKGGSASGGNGGTGKGGTSSGGAGGKSGSAGATGGSAGNDANAVWYKASLTNFESYPDPGSEECVKYNGCTWAGQFAALDGKQTEAWVMAHNIAAVHSKDFDKYKLKTLRLRKDGHEIDVVVYDECADSDCSGCCTQNAKPSGNLIDLEKYTAERFGVPADGQVEWRCLDCN